MISAVSGSVSTIDRVHAVGEGRPRRRVVVACPPGPAPRPRPTGGLSGSAGAANWVAALGRLVEGVAQRVGQHRDRAEVDRGVRGALDRTTPSTISRSSASASSASAAIRSAFCAHRARRPARPRCPLITAAREAKVPTAYLNRRVSPVVTSIRSNGTPELVGDDLREHRLVPLALRGQAGGRPRPCRRSRPGRGRPRRARRRCPRRSRRARCRPAGPRRGACSRNAAKSSQPTSSLSLASEAGKSPES